MQIHLINLDRSTDRLQQFGRVNAHIGEVVRFSAADGGSLDVPALIEKGIVERGIRAVYSPGALGNALSHVSLWERVVREAKPITICEDDAIFSHQFKPASERLLGSVPEDWDVIMWGWNYDSPLEVVMPGLASCMVLCDYVGVPLRVEAFQSRRIPPTLLRLRQAFGLACYSISPSGAQALLGFCLPIREMSVHCRATKGGFVPNIGIDLMMSAAFPRLKAFACLAPLVISTNDWSQSTVR